MITKEEARQILFGGGRKSKSDLQRQLIEFLVEKGYPVEEIRPAAVQPEPPIIIYDEVLEFQTETKK